MRFKGFLKNISLVVLFSITANTVAPALAVAGGEPPKKLGHQMDGIALAATLSIAADKALQLLDQARLISTTESKESAFRIQMNSDGAIPQSEKSLAREEVQNQLKQFVSSLPDDMHDQTANIENLKKIEKRGWKVLFFAMLMATISGRGAIHFSEAAKGFDVIVNAGNESDLYGDLSYGRENFNGTDIVRMSRRPEEIERNFQIERYQHSYKIRDNSVALDAFKEHLLTDEQIKQAVKEVSNYGYVTDQNIAHSSVMKQYWRSINSVANWNRVVVIAHSISALVSAGAFVFNAYGIRKMRKNLDKAKEKQVRIEWLEKVFETYFWSKLRRKFPNIPKGHMNALAWLSHTVGLISDTANPQDAVKLFAKLMGLPVSAFAVQPPVAHEAMPMLFKGCKDALQADQKEQEAEDEAAADDENASSEFGDEVAVRTLNNGSPGR